MAKLSGSRLREDPKRAFSMHQARDHRQDFADVCASFRKFAGPVELARHLPFTPPCCASYVFLDQMASGNSMLIL